MATLVTYFAVGTAIHAVTPKVQDDMNYTVGSVYLFYSIGFVCVTLLLQAGLVQARRKLGSPAYVTVIAAIFVFGMYQAAYNTQLTSSLRVAWGYSLDVLAAATEQVTEEERCSAWEGFAAAQPPPYGTPYSFESYVSEAFRTYASEFGEPFCTEALTTRLVSGAYPREEMGGGGFWWMNSSEATFDVGRHPGSEGAFTFSMMLSSPPCPEARTVVVSSIMGINRIELSGNRTEARVELALPRGVGSLDIVVRSDGPVCRVPSDPRDLLLGVHAAEVQSYAR